MTGADPGLSLHQQVDPAVPYRGIFEAARDAIFVIDVQGVVLDWNPAAERLFGYPRDRAVGTPIGELIVPPELLGSYETFLRGFRDHGRMESAGEREVFDAVRADGSRFPAEVTISTVELTGGRFVIGQLRDVSEQRKIVGDLRFRQALLELQSEASIDGILVVDDAWKPQWWNQRFCELTAITHDELASADDRFARSVLNVLAEPGELLAEIRELTEQPAKTIRNEMLMRDGRVFDRWTAPLVDRDGDRLGWVWTIRDITEQKAAERSLREAEDEADLLAQTSSVLASSMQREVILERLAGLITERLADVCLFEERSADDEEARVALSFSEPRLRSRFDELVEVYGRDPLEGAGSSEAMATGETHIVEIPPGPEERLDQARRFLARLGLTYTVAAPLRAGSRVVGSITLGSTSVGARARHARLAQTIASRISVALENLELYDERDRMARTLQEALRPRTLPEIAGIEVAARYRPAGDGSEIGGDFFDVFPMRGRSSACVLGDVSGKGAEAAQLTALTRYTLRAAVLGTRAPVRMLSVLNATLLRQQDSDRFCSVVCARVTRRLGGRITVDLANAGHPLPYVLGPSGLKRVGRGGTLLGVVREPSIGRDVFRLRAGEALVFCTDGVVEARRGDEFFGEERLEALLGRHANSSAATIAEVIEAAAIDFQGGAARDDIAILVVRRVRKERRGRREARRSQRG